MTNSTCSTIYDATLCNSRSRCKWRCSAGSCICEDSSFIVFVIIFCILGILALFTCVCCCFIRQRRRFQDTGRNCGDEDCPCCPDRGLWWFTDPLTARRHQMQDNYNRQMYSPEIAYAHAAGGGGGGGRMRSASQQQQILYSPSQRRRSLSGSGSQSGYYYNDEAHLYVGPAQSRDEFMMVPANAQPYHQYEEMRSPPHNPIPLHKTGNKYEQGRERIASQYAYAMQDDGDDENDPILIMPEEEQYRQYLEPQPHQYQHQSRVSQPRYSRMM